MSFLEDVVRRKRAEVESRKREEKEVMARAREASRTRPVRDFLARFTAPAETASGVRIIAEFKRASPSRGVIRADADPASIARAYQSAGASALSVLTDGPAFQGSLSDLEAAREAVSLPVLRKDFIVDLYQVQEARAAGADAVLLIAAVLSNSEIAAFAAGAAELGMTPLLEVHDREEMERAVSLRELIRLVGINNRNLKTLEVSLETTRRLLDLRSPAQVIVSESGFSRWEELEMMRAWGVDAFLIGESLMRSPDPGAALRELTGGQSVTGAPAGSEGA